MTTDMGAAEAFYQPVVGWTTAPFDGAGQPYSIWNRPDGAPMGGVMTLPDELKAHRVLPHWMMYVGVNKLEDAVAHAKRLGGSTVSEVIEVPNVGRMQVLKDPQGAAFYVYEPGPQPQPPDGTPAIGDTSWIELYTTDSVAAMKFYGELFGWKPTESMDMGPMGVYRMFGRSGMSIGGMMNKTPDMAHIQLAAVLPRTRRSRCCGAHQSARRPRDYGAHGSPGWQLDTPGPGPAGRDICAAPPQGLRCSARH